MKLMAVSTPKRAAYVIDINEVSREDIAGLHIETAFDRWQTARGTAFAPTRRDFSLETLPTTLIPDMALVDFIGPPLDYYYRFFGTGMADIAGLELSGKTYFKDGISGYGFINASLFPIMIEKKEPMFHRSVWVSVRGVHYTTTSVRLPLSEDGVNVTGVAIANWYRPVY